MLDFIGQNHIGERFPKPVGTGSSPVGGNLFPNKIKHLQFQFLFNSLNFCKKHPSLGGACRFFVGCDTYHKSITDGGRVQIAGVIPGIFFSWISISTPFKN